MKVLLTGASGMLGRHLARRLKQDDHAVRTVLHQRTVTRRDAEREIDEVLWGSLLDHRVMERALEEVELVVHSAWKFSRQDASRPTENEVLTERLFRRSMSAGVRRFAFISSVAVYGMRPAGAKLVDESSRLAPDDEAAFIYPSEKMRLENMIRSPEKGGMMVGIFRPGPIFDDHKGPMKKIMRFAGRDLAVGFGNGRNHLPFIHGADVADAVVCWLEHGNNDIVCNLTPSASPRHREFYRAWGSARGMTLTPLFIPGSIIRLAAFGGGFLKRMLGKPGKIDVRYALATSRRDLLYSNTLARSELAWRDDFTEPVTAEALER